MSIFSSSAIKQLLEKYNIEPNKRFGQNFLIDQNILNKIIEASDIQKDDIILEVGPGLGVLTFALAEKAKKVIAVEKDRFMFDILADLIDKSGFKNIELVNQDILKFSIFPAATGSRQGGDNFQFSNYKVVANIPYYLTSPLIRKFLESEQPPQAMILMIQKQVAQRICAKPPDMSLLAVSVQYYAEPKIISYVSKNSFWPIPKVDSAIISVKPYVLPLPLRESLPVRQTGAGVRGDNTKFFNLVRAGFSSPRKQLINNLIRYFLPRPACGERAGVRGLREQIESALKNCGLDPKQRAETLSVNDWQKLTEKLF